MSISSLSSASGVLVGTPPGSLPPGALLPGALRDTSSLSPSRGSAATGTFPVFPEVPASPAITLSLSPEALAAGRQPPNPPVQDGAGASAPGQRSRADGEPREGDRGTPAQNADGEQLSDDALACLHQLRARDREVRQHEAAHQVVGGQYAGAVSYTFQRGPDGLSYAIGGEVPIDISPVANDPAATIEKMRVVQAAAMAPAQPSAQDRQVAAAAAQAKLQAQSDLAAETDAEPGSGAEETRGDDAPDQEPESSGPDDSSAQGAMAIAAYRSAAYLQNDPFRSATIDAQA